MSVMRTLFAVVCFLCFVINKSHQAHQSTIELQTEDKLEYQFLPVSTEHFHFKVRAPHDAHIALTPGPAAVNPMYEIFIGGWKNTKSVIRVNGAKPDAVSVATPAILSGDEYTGFWIRWTATGLITATREGETTPFMSWQDPTPTPVKVSYVGVSTGWGAEGAWLIESNRVKG